MGKDRFNVSVGAFITFKGEILLGKKEEDEDHPLSGQWHLPGGHVEIGETPEEGLKREIEEETGLEGQIHQLVEVDYSGNVDTGVDDLYRIIYHFEADSKDAEPEDDIEELKWVDPKEYSSEVGKAEKQYLEQSQRTKNFIEKLEKMPVV